MPTLLFSLVTDMEDEKSGLGLEKQSIKMLTFTDDLVLLSHLVRGMGNLFECLLMLHVCLFCIQMVEGGHSWGEETANRACSAITN